MHRGKTVEEREKSGERMREGKDTEIEERKRENRVVAE